MIRILVATVPVLPRALVPSMRGPAWLSGRSQAAATRGPLPEATALRDVLLLESLVSGCTEAQEIDELVDACVAARAPFRTEMLGGGLWRACYSRGAEQPRWQRNQQLLGRFGFANRAGQAYDPETSRVVNYGEVAGRRVHFTAEGTFAAVTPGGTRCPQEFSVDIEQGGFVLFGKRFVSSKISGPGFLRVLYADEDLRIFQSPKDSPDTGGGRWESAGLVVVQVRDGCFDDDINLEVCSKCFDDECTTVEAAPIVTPRVQE